MSDSFSTIKTIWDLIYPRECFYCGKLASQQDNFPGQICTECENRISRTFNVNCPQCGKSVPDSEFFFESQCRCCREPDLRLMGIISIGEYHSDNSIGEIILSIKHGGRTDLVDDVGRILAKKLIENSNSIRFHAVTAVPLHRFRFFKRGYNQAALIGRSVAKYMQIPFYEWLIYRSRRTKPQSGSPTKRKKNVQNAFISGGFCKNARIILVDDVFTTGATTGECSKVLVNAGADAVMIGTAAWVSLKKKQRGVTL